MCACVCICLLVCIHIGSRTRISIGMLGVHTFLLCMVFEIMPRYYVVKMIGI